MKPVKPLVTEVASLRATEYSADGLKVTVSLTTKYTSERLYSVPLSCLSEFIADLERLKSAEAASPAATHAGPSADTRPAAPASSAPTQRDASPNPKEIKVNLPKKWILASGLPRHPMVILVFDPQTETQAGFGFGGPAAREMAAGLIKYADQIAQLAEKPSKS
jgi:hypothetical protein